jgi:PAS domain S-box-containing protein
MSDKGLFASMRRLLGSSPRQAAGAEVCLYRLIADSSAGWEYLEDPDDRMLWVSPSCEPITGHAPDEFLENPELLLAIVHPEDRALLESHRRECRLSGDSDEAEFRIVRPDGGVRWIGHRCQPISLPGGTSVGRRSSNREITKRKNAEGELLRRNRTLRALSNSNQSLVRATVESDLLEDVCRIVVEDCGHAMVWIGYAEENEGKTVRPVAHFGFDHGYLDKLNVTWADTERGRGPTGTAIRTGQPAACRNMRTDPRFAPWREEALKRGYESSIAFPLAIGEKIVGAITIYAREPDPFSDDEVKLLAELAGDLSFGIASIRGRTAQAAAELELREGEQRYRSLFESMDEGFAACEMIYDEAGKPSDFRYLSVNPAFARLTGLPLERAVGRTAKELIPSFEPSWIEAFGRVVQSGQSERLDNPVAELGRHFEVFAWRSGIDRFAVVFTDATERKQAEARLRELNETLEKRVAERTAEAERRAAQLKALAFELSQAERSERLVLANAIHDHLQQILVAAKLNLDALQSRFGDEKLRSDLQRVAELLDDSLTWCRSATVSLSPPVLQETGLAGGLGWLARQMQERQGLQVNLSVCDDWIEPADADLNAFLFEAVRELLFNVVRHSGERAARVALRREDKTFEIRVEDDGKGFDLGILRERAQQRARFGLFSIQQRLEMIGGSMSVESAPGRGTRVALRVLSAPVPAKAEAVAGRPAGVVRKEAPGQARSGRVRVVIADDHAIFRQGFSALLRAEGWIDVVGEAADGGEAVELARTLRPDVIVMDVSMPKMSGIEATRQIVAELPGVRVVGLSMHEDEEIAASMREAGAVDFVTKGGPSNAAISAIYAARFGGKKP